MSNESKSIKIDELEQFDAAENLLSLLNKLSIKSAKSALKDLQYDLKADFYCGDCEAPHDDCYGHPDYDDYPDYEADYDEHADVTDDKPIKNDQV